MVGAAVTEREVAKRVGGMSRVLGQESRRSEGWS